MHVRPAGVAGPRSLFLLHAQPGEGAGMVLLDAQLAHRKARRPQGA